MAGLVLLWAGADGTVDPIQIPAHSATAALVTPKIVLMYSLYDTLNEADDDFGLKVNCLANSQESIHFRSENYRSGSNVLYHYLSLICC